MDALSFFFGACLDKRTLLFLAQIFCLLAKLLEYILPCPRYVTSKCKRKCICLIVTLDVSFCFLALFEIMQSTTNISRLILLKYNMLDLKDTNVIH